MNINSWTISDLKDYLKIIPDNCMVSGTLNIINSENQIVADITCLSCKLNCPTDCPLDRLIETERGNNE